MNPELKILTPEEYLDLSLKDYNFVGVCRFHTLSTYRELSELLGYKSHKQAHDLFHRFLMIGGNYHLELRALQRRYGITEGNSNDELWT
jgi:hypothetical protein